MIRRLMALVRRPSQEQLTRDAIRSIMSEELGPYMDHYLRDMEWRYKQARDLYEEIGVAQVEGYVAGAGRQMTAEDLNLTGRHLLTGYTINNGTNGTPAGTAASGQIAWTGLHIVYAGVDYTVTDGATTGTNKYVYFQKSAATASGNTGTVTLTQSATKPTLGADDLLVFINNNGTAIVSASDAHGSLPSAVANNAVDNAALQSDSVYGAVVKDTGIGANKLGTGAINLSTMFTGGIVNNAAIGTAAVAPQKLNIASHLLY